MEKISVIVPVHNVQEFLKDCLNSLINQSFTDIEIICVNDGSTDLSGYILEQYKLKDSRLIVINQENGGLSNARNNGIKVANGEYICFVDSDDFVHEDYCQKLHDAITKQYADYAICNFYSGDNDKWKKRSSLKLSNRKQDSIYAVSAWNKLIKKEFLTVNELKFPDGEIYEDTIFSLKLNVLAQKVAVVEDYLYYYRVRNDSITGKRKSNLISTSYIFKDLLEFSKTRESKERSVIYEFATNYFLWAFHNVSNKFKRNFYFQNKVFLKKMNFKKSDLQFKSRIKCFVVSNYFIARMCSLFVGLLGPVKFIIRKVVK